MNAVYSRLEASPLPFLHLMEVLKHLPRTGWLRTIRNPESVAAHMYRLSLLAMFAPDNLDVGKCIFLALCHDMAESVVGDIPTYAGVAKEQKFKLEDFGMRYIQSLLNPVRPTLGTKLRETWLEYEEGKTAEARFVREMDKFECMIQAHEYELSTHGEKDLEEFQGLSPQITSPEGKAWLELLQHERQAHFLKRKQRVPVVFFIGAPGCGKKTQCELLSRKLGFQMLSIKSVLHTESENQTYPHATFVKECLKEQIDVPVQLAVSLLERQINLGVEKGNKWSLVHDFPECIQELLQFEKNVQKPNYTVVLKRSAEEMLQHREDSGNGSIDELKTMKRIEDSQVWNADVENHLRAAEGHFKEIDGHGSVEDVHRRVLQAVEDFMQHAEEGV